MRILELPIELYRSLQGLPGFDEKAFREIHQLREPVTAIRINPKKYRDDYMGLLPISAVVPWNTNGYYLKERPSFTADPLFHGGAYYVQDASSMFLEEVFHQICDLHAPLKVLDLCAAPGGKSTLIYSLLNDESLLVSNEVIKARVGILEENLTKWGAANIVVSKNDPRDFTKLTDFFDVIVVDAPCSGSGLFRKDADAVDEWSLQHVNMCAERQKRILADVLPALRPGGKLIYATCSYSREEDENISEWLVNQFSLNSLRLKLKPEWKIIENIVSPSNTYGYRFYPYLLKGEGFFISVFSKPGQMESLPAKGGYKFNSLSNTEKDIVSGFCSVENSLFHFPEKGVVSYIPPPVASQFEILSKQLYIKKTGIRIGELMHGELIPDHELALSNFIGKEVKVYDVDRDVALEYLRKNPITLPANYKGWCLIKYAGIPIGWVKALAGRVNNYYPKSWRILNK